MTKMSQLYKFASIFFIIQTVNEKAVKIWMNKKIRQIKQSNGKLHTTAFGLFLSPFYSDQIAVTKDCRHIKLDSVMQWTDTVSLDENNYYWEKKI